MKNLGDLGGIVPNSLSSGRPTFSVKESPFGVGYGSSPVRETRKSIDNYWDRYNIESELEENRFLDMEVTW